MNQFRRLFSSLTLRQQISIGIVLVGLVMGLFLWMENRLPALWKWRSWGRLLHAFGVWWGIPIQPLDEYKRLNANLAHDSTLRR
jgi:hypothetical protein